MSNNGGRRRVLKRVYRSPLTDIFQFFQQHFQDRIACNPSAGENSGRRALFCRDPDGNALEFIEETG